MYFSYVFAVSRMFGYAGPFQFTAAIVIVLIGVPVGFCAAGVLVPLLEDPLPPELDQVANYESSNEDYVVEDYGKVVLVRNIVLGKKPA